MSDQIYMHAKQVESLPSLAKKIAGGGGAIVIENASGELKFITDAGKAWRLLLDGGVVQEDA